MADNLPTVNAYRNLGGINQKASEYSIDKAQFLNLSNVDFDVPNALQKRPGSTQAVSVAASGPVSSLFEFIKLDGSSYVIAGDNTALWYKSGASFSVLDAGWTNGQPADMLTFLNKLWVSDGQRFKNWDGITTATDSICQCPPLIHAMGFTGTGSNWWGLSLPYVQMWYFYSYALADGRVTPANPFSATPVYTLGNIDTSPSYVVMYFTSPPFTPANIFATCINIYAFVKGSTTSAIGNPDGAAAGLTLRSEYLPYFKKIAGISTGAIGYTVRANLVTNWSLYTGEPFSGLPFCFADTFTPKYLEVNQNSMFYAGFSAAPSTIWFSDLGKPQLLQEDSFFEVRTNDGDRILATKTYGNQVIVMKENSFHKILGDSPENFELVEISNRYGCLSNKTVIEYEQKLLWLDKKGILEFNGANYDIISTPVEDIFRRMNVEAAKEKAVAVHEIYRNQVWFGIPIDGATQNNITIVYDYLVKAWTFFEGFRPASFAMIKQSLDKSTVWRGDYSGMIYYHSASFLGDNGSGITCLIRPHWDKNKENETWIWRRLFLDVGTATGLTGQITGKVFSNYDNSTVQATFAMYQDAFQSRAEIGVPAKAVTAEMAHYSASLPLLVNGYSWAKRFLRNV